MDLPLQMTSSIDNNHADAINEGYGVPPSDPMSVDLAPLSPTSLNPNTDPAAHGHGHGHDNDNDNDNDHNNPNHDASSTGAPSVAGSATNRPIEPSSLFVGRLHAEVRASDLEVLFSKYGHIKRCELKRGGYAFVEFDGSDAAREALKEDGTKMHGESIAVMFAKARQAEPGSSGCFRCGAPDHWSRECPHRFEDRGLGLPKWCMPGVRDRDARGSRGGGPPPRDSGRRRGRSPSPHYSSSSSRRSRRYSRSRSRSPAYRRSSRRYSRSPSPVYRSSRRRYSRSRSPVARSSRAKYASRSRSRSPAPRASRGGARHVSRSRSPVARRARSYSRSRSRSRSPAAGARGRSPVGRGASRSPAPRGYSRSVSRD